MKPSRKQSRISRSAPLASKVAAVAFVGTLGGAGGVVLAASAGGRGPLIHAAFVLVSALAGAAIAKALAGPLLSPLTELRKGLDRVAAGKLDGRIEHRRDDELGESLAAYNRMAQSLDEARDRQRARETELTSANERLAAASRSAEASVKAKSVHLATMSHEIRTPINGIIGLTEILSERSADAEQTKLLRAIGSSGSALMSLINDFLDLSKLEAGKLELCLGPINFKEFIQDLYLSHQPLAAKKGIELRSAIHDRVPDYLICDSLRLRQVLTNLLSNAIKFTKSGYVSLEAQAFTVTSAEATLKIAVRDTGIGIDKANRTKLFQAFSQADQSTAREFGGTGLGLAISQSIVEKMGSKIGLESKAGKGSCFSFVIKLRIPDNDELPSEEPARGDIKYDGSLAGYAALLADDSPVNRLTFELQIAKLGCALDLATNGREAFEAVRRKRYDFVLMDVIMPEVDGLEATRRIRSWEAETGQKPVPIIALTANAFSEQKAQCLDAGMDDFLAKPTKREAIAEKALRWIAFANGDRSTKIEVSSKAKPRKGKPNNTEPDRREGRETLCDKAKPGWTTAPDAGDQATRPTLDFSFLDGLDSVYGEDAAPEILAEFLKEGRKSFDAFVEACAQRDADRIAETAHKLKGETGTVGFHALAHELNQLKTASAVSADLDRIPTKASEIARAFEGLCSAIRERLDRN